MSLPSPNANVGARQRRSQRVFAPLLVSAGLLGLPGAFGLAGCSRAKEKQDEPATPMVDAAESYPNNHYLPGAGYYHSPFHAWFPLPYNHFVGGQGFYRGGNWRSGGQADAAELADERRASAFMSRSPGGAASGLRADASRPSPDAVSRANALASSHARSSVLPRSGFGQSARPGYS